jgi:hypothetical protein
MANDYRRGQSNDMYGRSRNYGSSSPDYDNDYEENRRRHRMQGGRYTDEYGSSRGGRREDEERGYGQSMQGRRGSSYSEGGYTTGRESYGSRGYDDDYGATGQGSRYGGGSMRGGRHGSENDRYYRSGENDESQRGYGTQQNYGSGPRYGSSENYGSGGSGSRDGSNQNYGTARGYRRQTEYQQPGYSDGEGMEYRSSGQRGYGDYEAREYGRQSRGGRYEQNDFGGYLGNGDRGQYYRGAQNDRGRGSRGYGRDSDFDEDDRTNPQIW